MAGCGGLARQPLGLAIALQSGGAAADAKRRAGRAAIP